jgi:hypothetical protein
MNALSGISTETTPYGDQISYFKFASGTTGEIKFASTNIKEQYNNNGLGKGFALELYARCNTLGETNETGFYLNTSNATFKLCPGKAYINFNGVVMEANISTRDFSHVVFVYDPSSAEISTASPYATLRIYVDGILTKID